MFFKLSFMDIITHTLFKILNNLVLKLNYTGKNDNDENVLHNNNNKKKY